MKKTATLISILIITGLILVGNSSNNNVSALTYQTSTDVSFTFNPTISVSLSSSDLVINELAPGTYSDSNIITVTTSTNSTGGYTLLASVGNSTYNSRNLTQSGVADVFSSIATDASLASLTTTNTWGYATSDNGTTWSNYSGLPLYNSTDITTGAKTLVPTTGQSGSGTLGFKIAAYADTSMSGGTYSNIINFIATAEVEPVTFNRAFYDASILPGSTITKLGGYYKMQDINSSICSSVDNFQTSTLIDSRDHNTYTVAKINGGCWMTQNLRFVGASLNSTTSNVETKYTPTNPLTLTWYDLKTAGAGNNKCAKGTASNPLGYTNTCKHSPNSTDDADALALYNSEQLGVWYNYAGATAGTITGYSNSATASYSICPKNWTLPSYSTDSTVPGNIHGLTSKYSLANANAFRPIYGGNYYDGIHGGSTNFGIWWSSIASNTLRRYHLGYASSLYVDSNHDRYLGFYVRCVHAS